jgi:hypothetical protein
LPGDNNPPVSAGHGHSRPNLKHPKELAKLLTEGGAPELMHRWQRLDPDHDINDLAGYNVAGTVRFIDRDAFHALLNPAYAEHIGVGPIDTGLSGEDTIACIIEHESDEKVLLDADNNVNTYPGAHEFASTGEDEKVIAKGSTPLRYNRGLKKLIEFCAKKNPVKVPRDYACAPLLDDPDANDKRVLARLRQLGVIDAFKVSKASQDYSKAVGADKCFVCKGWQGDRSHDLSPCAVVDGLVTKNRWCRAFKTMETANVQAQGLNPQQPPGQQLRSAG